MTFHINRRKFLKSSLLAVPAISVSSTGEALARYEQEVIGVSKWELETPALCVDLDALDFNLKEIHQRLKKTGIAVRPHAKTHKCPAIAHMQMKAGAIGICTAKLSESEVMLENGLSQVLMTSVNISPSKIKKAMMLSKRFPGFIQAADHSENVKDLQDAAQALGIIADVAVDIDVIRRSGVLPGKPALALAQMVDAAPNLRFKGILAYDGAVQHVHGYDARKARAIRSFEPVVETFEMMKASGLNMEIFSGGGTGTYDMMHEFPGFTDVQAGSYLFMDCQYIDIGGKENDMVFDDFKSSLTVLTTIVNANHAGRLVTDGGAKAMTLNRPTGRVIGESGFTYNASSDEYGSISFEESAKSYRVGDILEVIVPHCDPVINLYDHMYGIRNEKVEMILPILARGKSQ
ncbi:MAG: DSD1 family PLP-dependent enzyme [Cyclobacteriaceae bacterium]|nr:DSD1 family PLP-dependent enzyme [Cyclobacteriaceae bacterium]